MINDMKTHLFVWSMALVMSLAMYGCKGEGNDPTQEGNYRYNKKGSAYEVFMPDGKRVYLRSGVSDGKRTLSIRDSKWYYQGVTGEYEEYIYKGDVVFPNFLVIDGEKQYVTSIPAYDYSGLYNLTELTSVRLPDSLSAIGEGNFRDCTKLSDINFPEKVDKININVCCGCTSLKTCTIPKQCSHIDASAFDKTSLEKVVCYSENVDLGHQGVYDESYHMPFNNTPKFDLYVPKAYIDTYKNSKWTLVSKQILPLD